MNIDIDELDLAGRTFLAKLNIQNPPKPPFAWWFVREADDTSNWEFTVAGYEFTKELRKDSIGRAEGASTETNFRKVFLPETGHYVVSRDFSGQELRVLANLSGEQSWIDTFNSGGDIHERTAKTVWGEEGYDRRRRNMAKAINFGLAYGITNIGLSKDIGTTPEEAQVYIDTFFSTHPQISRYLARQKQYAAQHWEIVNHYGRKRRLHNEKDYKGSLSSSGERKSMNTPIQSMGAEITKLALLKIYKNILTNDKYREHALWMSTIHDEINLSVSYDMLETIADLMDVNMVHTIAPNLPVKITTGLDIGHSMGVMWSFNQDKETKVITPVYEPLTADDVEKQKEMRK